MCKKLEFFMMYNWTFDTPTKCVDNFHLELRSQIMKKMTIPFLFLFLQMYLRQLKMTGMVSTFKIEVLYYLEIDPPSNNMPIQIIPAILCRSYVVLTLNQRPWKNVLMGLFFITKPNSYKYLRYSYLFGSQH